MSNAPPRLYWKYYTFWGIVFIAVFQVAYNILLYGPTEQVLRDALYIQIFVALASTNVYALYVTISYIRLAEPSVKVLDKAAFVAGKVFEHAELRGLSEDEAARRITSLLDIMHDARPLLSQIGTIQPRHIERGIKMLNLLLKAGDSLTDEQLEKAWGRTVGRALEKAVGADGAQA